jgi:hypothetical protein
MLAFRRSHSFSRAAVWIPSLWRSIADYDMAIKLSPNYADNRGDTRRDAGDEEGAIADYQQALTFSRNFKQA